MNILHIIKNPDDTYAWKTVAGQRSRQGNRVTVLLLHDAVFSPVRRGDRVFACRDDVLARGVRSKAVPVDYQEMVNMILESESVVCW